MHRRTIVGFGEAFLVEHPDRVEVAGLAAEAAARAVRLGHRGVIVTRLGQDDTAREVLALLGSAGVETAHVQADPDLPTPRIVERGAARARGAPRASGAERPALPGVMRRSAFDNVQWDFDLEDVAQVADAVVFGLVARRAGQTRSEQNRFLEACGRAVRVLDLTNRASADFDRGDALTALALSSAAIVDETAINVIAPRSRSQPLDQAVASFVRERALSFAIAVGPAAALALHVLGEAEPASFGDRCGDRLAAALAVVQTILNGQEPRAAVEIAHRLSASGAPATIA